MNKVIQKIFFIDYIIIFLILIVVIFINNRRYRKIRNELEKNKVDLEKNLNFLRTIMNTIPDPLFCKDVEGKYTECNIQFEKILGLKKEQIINKTVYEINQGKFGEIFHKADMELIKTKDTQTYETKVKYSEGDIHDVLFRKAAILSDKNEVDGMVGIMIDVTEDKNNRDKLNKMIRIKEAMLEINQSIIGMDNINDLFELILKKIISVTNKAEVGTILILDENNMLRIASSVGYDDDEAIKKFELRLEESFMWSKTNGDIKDTVIINKINESYKEKYSYVNEVIKKRNIRSAIATPIFVEDRLYGILSIDSNVENPFNQDDVEIMQYTKSQIEIAINKHRLYEQIFYLSNFDKVTNLYNRRGFEELLDKKFNSLIIDNKFIYVVFIDLDGLKKVNDTFGHLIGDKYIKEFVNEFRKVAKNSDIISRYGGDEFVGVFTDIDKNSLTNKFEIMSKNLKNNPLKYNEHSIVCKFSYGISVYSIDGTGYSELIKIADKRMYQNKRINIGKR